MRCALSIVVCVALISAGDAGFAQTAQTPPAAPKPSTPPPATPAPTTPAKPPSSGTGQVKPAATASRLSIGVQVTSLEGKTLPDVWVKASGPVDREGPTDSS